ncbi:MAG: cytochrome c-type biogenesis protein CcmH [Deltaproteobacteria bacterium]|nr:cytochrome c-type biogenesis protein CcmH [Deltaproteobacteria bacterium]
MRRLFLVLIFFLPVLTLAAVPGQDLDSRARTVADQLRCPVCRGIPIAESPSELARDMMGVIRQKLAEGQSEEEILRYFEDRYGEWILLKPKAKGMNLLVWGLPALLLVGGGIFLAFKISRWSSRSA